MNLIDQFISSAKELGADDTILQNLLSRILEDYGQRCSILDAAKKSTPDPAVRERLDDLAVIPFLRCDNVGIQAGFVNPPTLATMQEEEEDIIIPAMALVRHYHQ